MSFFSFQDIIACVTGIMVLVTLLLALELVQRKPGPPEVAKVVQANLEELKTRRDAIRTEVDQCADTLKNLSSGVMVTRTQVGEIERSVQAVQDATLKAKGGIEEARREGKEAAEKLEKTQDDVAALSAMVARMESQLTNLPGKVFGKQAIYVECSGAGCVLAELADRGPNLGLMQEISRLEGEQWPRAFLAWVRGRQARKDKEAYVLLVRPDAVLQWHQIHRNLAQMGFDVGWDVWPESRKLMGPRR